MNIQSYFISIYQPFRRSQKQRGIQRLPSRIQLQQAERTDSNQLGVPSPDQQGRRLSETPYRYVRSPGVSAAPKPKSLLERISPAVKAEIQTCLVKNPQDLVLGDRIGHGNFLILLIITLITLTLIIIIECKVLAKIENFINLKFDFFRKKLLNVYFYCYVLFLYFLCHSKVNLEWFTKECM